MRDQSPDIRGCSAAEIKRLQTKAGTPLPPDQTLFVRLSEGSAKTPVYYWSAERPRKTKQAFKSVWEFIKDELKGFEYACGR